MEINSRQYRDIEKRKIQKFLVQRLKEGMINMKTANEICPNCPANKNVDNGKVFRKFCVKFQWNIDKLIKANGKVPCNEICTEEEAKKLYAMHKNPLPQKFKGTGK